ncbi:unnamed protein product [Schistosoma curassoni]|nr:unnamed protein product [Schistosoma curassoni]
MMKSEDLPLVAQIKFNILHNPKKTFHGSLLDDHFITCCCPQLVLCQLRRDMRYMES